MLVSLLVPMHAQRRFNQSCAVGLEMPASRARRAVGTPSSWAAAIAARSSSRAFSSLAGYTNTVTQFNNWFGETFVERCEDAFVRVREMKDELNELLPGSSPQRPEPLAGWPGGGPNA